MNELQLAPSQGFMTPTNLQEAMQLADILAGSDIVPKDYQRKPGNILVAMQWGAEIGLKPLQAMQNIAVINGRPSIWGDAMLALVRGGGLLEYITETLSEDSQIATCTVKRKGEEAYISTFTMEDANKAGLAGKQGPWTQYPKRMLKLRARGYALRDVFPDVIKGMGYAEEEQDRQNKEIKDVTPPPAKNSGTGSIKDRLKAKRAEVVEVVETDVYDISLVLEQIKNITTMEQIQGVGQEIKALSQDPDINLLDEDRDRLRGALAHQRGEVIFNNLLEKIPQTTLENVNDIRQDIYDNRDKLGEDRFAILDDRLDEHLNLLGEE